MAGPSQSAWRCTVCGYVHQGTEPPDFCPICGADASDFEACEEQIAAGSPKPTRWRCLNCNYVHDGQEAPDLCPVCGVAADRFEPIVEPASTDAKAEQVVEVVIVGAGIAGVSAAEAIRQASTTSKIVLISHEPRAPYYRLNLTRYLAGEIDMDVLPIHPESWYEENHIDLLTGVSVDSLQPENRKVTLSDGSSLSYDKLILTMGSHAFIPPLPGSDLAGVTAVRTVSDAEHVLDRIKSGEPCVIIGGGILGLETAAALARRSAAVTLLESHAWLMPRQLNARAGKLLASHVEQTGIHLQKNARTERIIGDKEVKGVKLENGEIIPAGLVVIATGIRSNTHLARKAGLDVDRGIIVNNHLQTSNPDIFAAGDVAEHNGVTYGTWAASLYQGAMAGMNVLGNDAVFGGLPRSNVLKVLGIDLLSIGHCQPEDGSYLVLQHEENASLYHFVFHDSRMVGCILLGDASAGAAARMAIEGHADFSAFLSASPDAEELIEELSRGRSE